MNLPFTVDQFLDVFAHYNMAVWPMQIILNLLALIIIIFTIFKFKLADRINSLILAFFWFWIGVVYHLMFFSPINEAANLFAILFIIQSLVFLVAGTILQKISFAFEKNIYSLAGGILILYALLIYPILGYFLGHVYPWSPTFGLPCPTTIFTFGILLMINQKVPLYVLIIPFLWSLIGFSAAFNLLIYEDFGLVVAGITGTLLIYIKNKARPKKIRE